jgi:diguanylate cyclase (GGDEF)-like protein
LNQAGWSIRPRLLTYDVTVAKRLGVFDPTGRLIEDLAPAAQRSDSDLEPFDPNHQVDGYAGVLLPAAVAAELGPPADGAPPRWIVGEAANAARIAGAAASASAAGVLLAPVAPESLDAIGHAEATSVEFELARARGLIATSLVDLTGAAAETLRAVAEGFTAHDCIVWWRDGATMAPTAARPSPNDNYRTQIAAAARIAAAAGGTVILGDDEPRSVIADALRSGPTEIAGLVAIVSDSGRRFSAAERSDLKAISARLTRELSWLTSHRRIVAEGERLLASSLHDPLSGAMTRGAFEQTITHEVAAAGRRNEKLTLAMFDVVGLRRINLSHGHRAGDEVLAQIASRLRATVRGNDPMGRLGGDELAVLLVGAAEDQAVLVGRKILQRIQSEAIHVDESTQLAVQLRCVLTELATGERSGEAALSRCYGGLRTAPVGDVRVVPANDRATAEVDQGADTALSAGTIVGGTYRVVHELSRGAMGVVYRGEDLGLSRPVAIKVLRSDLASDRDLVDRFRAEAAILASLHHKNLVQVYALGEHAGEVYFVMELVEGQPLSEVMRATLDRREWFPIEALTQITLEIGDALDAMHALGLIHRDVKPANILLDRERDRAVLVDVGVAVKAGNQSDAAGTPGFAAPESFLEQEGTPQTDVYGLAATMYCALTGRPPFGSGPAPQVVNRQLNDPIVPASQLRPGILPGVDTVLAKALAPNPKKRWSSASTFAIALGRALERQSGEIRLPPVEENVAEAAAEAVMRPTAGIGGAGELIDANAASTGRIIGRVRAAHLRVLSRILQHHLGESGMAKLRLKRPELAAVLAPTLAPLAWVELSELVGALSCARDELASATLPRKVGRGTMSATFARLFGADPGSLAPETVLAALPTFWSRYHDWSSVVTAVRAGSSEITVEGFSGSPDMCAVVAAELERIVELTGVPTVGSMHPRCRCHGAPRCEFRVTWSK